ncbi:MAG: corrinoid protein [Methanomassiliicoccales archaeon]|jgi:corrinoid protein of di/trimethylamine methyltransferase
MSTDPTIANLEKAVIGMDEKGAKEAANAILVKKIDAGLAINDGLIKGMKTVAEMYDREDIYLPQVLASAGAFYAAFDILRPHMLAGSKSAGAKVVIGVVEGDIHDIGKNLVKTMIEANGFHCIDLGRDVPIEDFVSKVAEEKPQYVAMSTLMTPTMKSMRRIMEGMADEDVREGKKVLIGGGPIDDEFAKEIGADFYGKDESSAVKWLIEQK